MQKIKLNLKHILTLQELESWDEGEFELCTCNTEGEIECECKEQDVTCEEGEEMYTDENCQQLCAKGGAPRVCCFFFMLNSMVMIKTEIQIMFFH